MAEYRTDEPIRPATGPATGTAYGTTAGRDTVVERRGGGLARTLAILALIALVIVGVLFATGFWKMNATSGSLPKVNVEGGSMPKVGIQSDKIVVGTKTTTVEVPKIETKKAEVKVPMIGVQKKNDQ